MRILHYLGLRRLPRDPDREASGGLSRVALELAVAQLARGHRVCVAATAPEPWRATWRGVTLAALPLWPALRLRVGRRLWDARAQVSLVAYTHRHRIDVVHGHEHRDLRLVRARLRLAHYHNDPFASATAYNLAGKASAFWSRARGVQAHVAVSAYLAERLLTTRRLSATRAAPTPIIHVPNGVDARRFHPMRTRNEGVRLRDAWGVSGHDVLFLYVGAMVPQKGVIHLARAFVRLAEERADVRLVLAGTWTLWGGGAAGFFTEHAQCEGEIRTVLAASSAGERLLWLGLVSPAALPAVYGACDVVVVPSVLPEGFGLVVAEAMASGKPVVASATGALPALVAPYTGRLVAPGDEGRLLAAMRTLATDPELRGRLGAAGRAAMERLTWSAAAEALDDVYRWRLDGGHLVGRRAG